MNEQFQDKISGVLLGTAVGDAIGLPTEGLSRSRVKKLVKLPLRHRFMGGCGMVSDDTDHTIFVSQSLLACERDLNKFRKGLARKLKLWLLCFPAGVGFATLRSILKLWIGISPAYSGVYSAGNGAAMRSAPIGAYFSDDPERMRKFVKASTLITHSDPKAFIGAYAVSIITAFSIRESLNERPSLQQFSALLMSVSDSPEWQNIVRSMIDAINQNYNVERYATHLGLGNGVSGYVYHTVPVSLFTWYHHFGNFEDAITSVIMCGGDTDTLAAITGGMMGAVTGVGGIPKKWLQGIIDYPHGISFIIELGKDLSENRSQSIKFSPLLFFRGILFTMIVLAHGLRRVFPPY